MYRVPKGCLKNGFHGNREFLRSVMSSRGLLQRNLQRNIASAFLRGGSDKNGSHALENRRTLLPGCYAFTRIPKAALVIAALVSLLEGLTALGAAPLAD